MTEPKEKKKSLANIKMPDFKMPSFKMKKFDVNKLRKFVSPNAYSDLDKFLEALPQNAGQTVLIAAGLAWALAGAAFFYMITQSETIAALNKEYAEVQNAKPPVPYIEYTPVSQDRLQEMVEFLKVEFEELNFQAQGSVIGVSSSNVYDFYRFREAVSYIQGGGKDWKLKVSEFCAGDECGSAALSMSLSIARVKINLPN